MSEATKKKLGINTTVDKSRIQRLFSWRPNGQSTGLHPAAAEDRDDLAPADQKRTGIVALVNKITGGLIDVD